MGVGNSPHVYAVLSSYESNYRPKDPKDVSLPLQSIQAHTSCLTPSVEPIVSIVNLQGQQKLVLEKQTNQPWLILPLCKGSA